MTILQDTVTNEDGQVVEIYFEVGDEGDSIGTGTDTRGGRDHIAHAQETFTKAMSLIRTCSEHVARTIKEVPDHLQPHGFEVQFAINVNTEVGVVIAKSTAEAQLQVTLKWDKGA